MDANIGTLKGTDSFFAKIEQLSKVQRILIFSSVFIAIIAIFVFLLYKPKLAKISHLNNQLKTLEKKLLVAKKNGGGFEKIYRKKVAGSRSAV